jgi:Putative peptidoglycan binding domain/CHAP domain
MPTLSQENWVRDEVQFTSNLAERQEGKAVERVQEWLTFHGFGTDIDGDFGPATSKAVRSFQGARGLGATGIVDTQTYAVLTQPLRSVLAPINPPSADLPGTIVEYARQHLAAHPIELGGPNEGPWVRLYMKGRDGEAFLWCAGFACTVIRQACEAKGVPASVAYTMSCDDLGKAARTQRRFLAGRAAMGNGAQLSKIRPGSVFLIQNKTKPWDYIHTGIVIAVDAQSFTTIEGNTNREGSSNGFEVCRRERAYTRADFYLA